MMFLREDNSKEEARSFLGMEIYTMDAFTILCYKEQVSHFIIESILDNLFILYIALLYNNTERIWKFGAFSKDNLMYLQQ